MRRTEVLLPTFANRVNKIMDIWSMVQMAFGGGVVAGIVEVCAAIRHRKADKVKAKIILLNI